MVVLASDLHVGYHNRKAELSRWVGLINAEKPDLVLFAGDILDGALRPARVWRYDEEFRRIAAPVYSCLGIMNTSLPVQRHPALTVAKPFPCEKLAFFHTASPGRRDLRSRFAPLHIPGEEAFQNIAAAGQDGPWLFCFLPLM